MQIISARDVLLSASSYSIDEPDLIYSIVMKFSRLQKQPLEYFPSSPDTAGGGGGTTQGRAFTRDLLVIDDLDVIIDPESGGEDATINKDPERVLALNAIMKVIDTLVQKGNDMTLGTPQPFILGLSSAEPSDIPVELLRVGRFEKVITMPSPTQFQRERILQGLLRGLSIESRTKFGKPADEETVRHYAATLAQHTAGCVAIDLRRICADALTRALSRFHVATDLTDVGKGGMEMWQLSHDVLVTWTDLREAARSCVPSQLAQLDVAMTWPVDTGEGVCSDSPEHWKRVHESSWQRFGGYDEMKKRLYRTVVGPWKRYILASGFTSERSVSRYEARSNKQSIAKLGLQVRPPSGVLLHGPPGVGKTLAAQCLASSLGLHVVKVRASDVLDQWLGGSEAAIRSLFARARAAAPCVLFFDEIDALATNRQGDSDVSSDVHSRVLSTFLNEMDGISSHAGKQGVLVIAATNRIDTIDAALLRPGRLEEHVCLTLPTVSDIMNIMNLNLAKVPLGNDVDLEHLAGDLFRLNGSGADIEGICREACLIAIKRRRDCPQIKATMDDFDKAIRSWKS